EPQIDAEAAGDGYQVYDGIGGPADSHIYGDGVFESPPGEDTGWPQIFTHDIDDAAAAHLGHGEAARIGRWHVGAAWQRHAHRFGQASHGGSCAHDGAVAGAAGDAALDFGPLLL